MLPTKFLFLQKLMDLYNLTFLWLGKWFSYNFSWFSVSNMLINQLNSSNQSGRLSIYHKMKQIFLLVNNITYAKNAYICILIISKIQYCLELRKILGVAKKFLKLRSFLFETPQNPLLPIDNRCYTINHLILYSSISFYSWF